MSRKPTKAGTGRRRNEPTYLGGQLLIAMPGMPDPRFARSVIYMCTHNKDGAMGIIINQRAENITFPELLVQARILSDKDERTVSPKVQGMHVHIGGPVEAGRGFVLHTADFRGNDTTVNIDAKVSLTATIDILRAIVRGRGPTQCLLALGCAGWSPGQLEREISANGWLHAPADIDLVFDAEVDGKYERALGMLGINPSQLVIQAGHA